MTDVSNPNHAGQDAEVLKVLTDLGIEDRPRLHVLNKIDLLPKEELEALRKANGNASRKSHRIFVSAVTGEGLPELLKLIDETMPGDPLVRVHLLIPISDGRNLSLVHSCGRILHSEMDDTHFSIDAELPESMARRLKDFVPAPSEGRKRRKSRLPS